MFRRIVRTFNERSSFTLMRKPTAEAASESGRKYQSEVGFMLATYIHQASDLDLADLGRLLAVVEQRASRGMRPSSQLLQECFALAWNPEGPRIFVEVGAANPEFLSNTFVLQEQDGWTGLLVECNPISVLALQSRLSETVTLAAVAAGSAGEIDFYMAGELSTAADMLPTSAHLQGRSKAAMADQIVRVPRVPLNELLLERFAEERQLGFLSVDVEGGEEDVLNSIDWALWSFGAIAVEHNYRRDFEDDLDRSMASRGYRRTLQGFTGWDAWYVPLHQ